MVLSSFFAARAIGSRKFTYDRKTGEYVNAYDPEDRVSAQHMEELTSALSHAAVEETVVDVMKRRSTFRKMTMVSKIFLSVGKKDLSALTVSTLGDIHTCSTSYFRGRRQSKHRFRIYYSLLIGLFIPVRLIYYLGVRCELHRDERGSFLTLYSRTFQTDILKPTIEPTVWASPSRHGSTSLPPAYEAKVPIRVHLWVPSALP